MTSFFYAERKRKGAFPPLNPPWARTKGLATIKPSLGSQDMLHLVEESSE